MDADVILMYPPYDLNVAYVSSIPSLSGYLRKHGLDVVTCYEKTFKEIYRFCDKNPAKVMGVSIPFTCMAEEGKTLIRGLKEKYPDRVVIVGGVHPTLCPDEFDGIADFVCVGEGEETLREFLQEYINGGKYEKVKGLFGNKERDFISMDKVDLPDWDNVPSTVLTNGLVAIPYAGSRGCPFSCGFCSNWLLSKQVVRYRSVDNVVSDIKTIIDNTGFRVFDFRDETFTIYRSRVLEFCDKIKDLDIRWWCQTRANLIDRELASCMKDAGCIGISFGVESGDSYVLEKINKKIRLQEVESAVSILSDVGIDCYCGYILGHPWDTHSTISSTIAFADRSKAVYVGFSIMSPYPGTKAREYALEHGGIITNDWSKYHTGSVVYVAPGLEGCDMLELKEYAETYFYSKNIKRLLCEFRRRWYRKGWKPKAHFLLLLRKYIPMWFKRKVKKI